MFVRVAGKLNAAVAALPGVPIGVAGGAIVLASWVVTIPYGLALSVLDSVLKLFPGESAKPVYKLGRDINDNVMKIARPLNFIWRPIDTLRSNRTYRFWAINLLGLVGVTVTIWYLADQISAIIADTRFEVITLPFNVPPADAGFVSIDGNEAIWVAVLKGVGNTLALVIISIFVASILGLLLWWIWLICLFVALAAALYLRRLLIHKEQATGNVYRPNLYSFLLFVGVAGVTYLILFFALGLNAPVGISLPVIDESRIVPRYEGGFIISIVFLAALLGLIFYFSAFIAEIVRGSIQAIPHGQSEAANSLGLSAYQRFTLVILPQALTIMIPSLNNEYQNVNKDSAVAFGIGYTETLFVLRQVANERGELVTLLIAGLLIYMFINLVISAIMNTVNRLNKVAR